MSLSDRLWRRALLGDVRSRPIAAVRERILISYIDLVNSMKNNVTPTTSVSTKCFLSIAAMEVQR